MNDTDIYEEYFEEADDIARTDSEAEGTVYKNSYASLMNELQPSTSFDDFKQSISHITEIFRTDPYIFVMTDEMRGRGKVD
ncbi:Protein CBG17346 [Caenorhabditis briggsae]|uniref:Protein CBG17346 n=1 Tax=Caenorhabditis briggsae TaxID=6238 RepID=A8XQV4_CAEBR|nr:Protein CBG17346 [Caenorhabditis briggsae]CAP35029.2 Protein CBG17346 [Caenorhabditis briggsae]